MPKFTITLFPGAVCVTMYKRSAFMCGLRSASKFTRTQDLVARFLPNDNDGTHIFSIFIFFCFVFCWGTINTRHPRSSLHYCNKLCTFDICLTFNAISITNLFVILKSSSKNYGKSNKIRICVRYIPKNHNFKIYLRYSDYLEWFLILYFHILICDFSSLFRFKMDFIIQFVRLFVPSLFLTSTVR